MIQAKQELKSVFARIGGALLIFLGLFNILLTPATVLKETLVGYFPSSAGVYIFTDLLNSLAYVATFIFPVFFFYMISKNKKTEEMNLSLRFPKERPVLFTLSVVLLGISVCTACSYVNSFLAPIPEAIYDSLFEQSFDNGYELVLMFLSTAIVPAFVEEFLFRGMILSNIRPYSESGAIFISAILFGLMHQTPFQLFYATAVGIVLGFVFVKTGSIWCGVLLHFFNNFLSVFQTYLLYALDVQTANIVFGIMNCALICAGILLSGIFYLISRPKKEKAVFEEIGVFGKVELNGDVRKTKLSNTDIVKALCTPTMIIFVVLCVVTIISTSVLMYLTSILYSLV